MRSARCGLRFKPIVKMAIRRTFSRCQDIYIGWNIYKVLAAFGHLPDAAIYTLGAKMLGVPLNIGHLPPV